MVKLKNVRVMPVDCDCVSSCSCTLGETCSSGKICSFTLMEDDENFYLDKTGEFSVLDRRSSSVQRFTVLIDIQKYAASHGCYILHPDEIAEIDLNKIIDNWH